MEGDEHDEHAESRGKQLPARGEIDGAPLDQDGAQDGAERRPQPAHGRRREHDEADRDQEGRLLVLLVHDQQQAAGQPGDEAGDGKGGELGHRHPDPVALRGSLVGGEGAEDAAGLAVA